MGCSLHTYYEFLPETYFNSKPKIRKTIVASHTNFQLAPRSKIITNIKYSTIAMPSYQRVAIHRNPKYKHNGTKSYVFAMSKCEFCRTNTELASSYRTHTISDGFNTTKPGPYFYAKAFESQGKFGGRVGGRMRTHHVLRKKQHPKPEGTTQFIVLSVVANFRYRSDPFRSNSFPGSRCPTGIVRLWQCGRSDC